MTRINLSDDEAYKRRFSEISSLMDCVDSTFVQVAERDGWVFQKDMYRHPTREIAKRSESGRTDFYIALIQDQTWFEVELEVNLAEHITYTFGVVSSTRMQESPPIVQRTNLVTGARLGEILPQLDSLFDDALNMVASFHEP